MNEQDLAEWTVSTQVVIEAGVDAAGQYGTRISVSDGAPVESLTQMAALLQFFIQKQVVQDAVNQGVQQTLRALLGPQEQATGPRLFVPDRAVRIEGR